MGKRNNQKGCSRLGKGGGTLAFTGISTPPSSNPFLAYTGGNNHKAYPNTGPVSNGANTIFNNASPQRGGNPGLPYPNGLAGSPWTPNTSTWPGVDGVPGNHNHLALNNYNSDISRQMISNPPIKGGRRTKRRGTRRRTGTRRTRRGTGTRRGTRRTRRREKRGGGLSNLMGQDLVNVGRQFQFGLHSAYNGVVGVASPVNPMPWKDQFVHSNNPIMA